MQNILPEETKTPRQNLYRVYYYGFAVDVTEEEMVKTVLSFIRFGRGGCVQHLIIDWLGEVDENGDGVGCTETAEDVLRSVKEVRDETKSPVSISIGTMNTWLEETKDVIDNLIAK